MSPSLVRLRLDGISPDLWRDQFADSVRDSGGSIRVIYSAEHTGLGAIDPTIIAALITGGASVVASVVAALMGSWLSSKKEQQSNADLRVEVLLIGSRTTERHLLHHGLTVPEVEKAIGPQLTNLGELREITISPLRARGGGR